VCVCVCGMGGNREGVDCSNPALPLTICMCCLLACLFLCFFVCCSNGEGEFDEGEGIQAGDLAFEDVPRGNAGNDETEEY